MAGAGAAALGVAWDNPEATGAVEDEVEMVERIGATSNGGGVVVGRSPRI